MPVTVGYEIVAITCEHPRYRPVFDLIEADDELNRLSREYAGSVIAQHLPVPDALTGEASWPARGWWMALTIPDGHPMAWAAAQMTWRELDGQLMPFVLARNSFHVPRFYGIDVYPQVYAAREKAIRHLPAVTYVYKEILGLHLDTGWEVFDTGWSTSTPVRYRWWGLRRGW